MKNYYISLFITIVFYAMATTLILPKCCYCRELSTHNTCHNKSALTPNTLFKYKFESIAELLKHRFRNRTELSVVDLDTGNGNFVVEFDKLLRTIFDDVDIFGVEWMRINYQEAHRKLHESGYRIKYAHAQDNVSDSPDNYLNIGLTNGSRNIVTVNNILNAYAMIPQATRIVSPHGLIFITVSDADVVEGDDSTIIRYLENNGMTVKRFDTLPADYPRTNENYQEGVLLIACRKEHPIDFSFVTKHHNTNKIEYPEANSI